MRTFKELKVWQKSYQLCLDVYKTTRHFPKEEKYGLNHQLRRAAVSIPSNIAEGYGRKTTQQYIYGLYLAYGSLCELETQLMICYDLGYMSEENHRKLQISIEEIGKMLKALIKSLESLNRNP